MTLAEMSHFNREQVVTQILREVIDAFGQPILANPDLLEKLYILIVLDGPGASGKGTLADFLKEYFNFIASSTGLFYRAVTAWYLDRKIKNIQALRTAFSKAEIKIVSDMTGHTNNIYFQIKDSEGIFLVNINDLRTKEVEDKVSFISAIEFICKRVDDLIVKMALELPRAIVDGRDGYHKFSAYKESEKRKVEQASRFDRIRNIPEASPIIRAFFLYLHASQEVLAERAITRKQDQLGRELTCEEKKGITNDIAERNRKDYQREQGKLLEPAVAEAAYENGQLYDLVLRTDNLTPTEVLLHVLVHLYSHIFPDSKFASSLLESVKQFFAELEKEGQKLVELVEETVEEQVEVMPVLQIA